MGKTRSAAMAAALAAAMAFLAAMSPMGAESILILPVRVLPSAGAGAAEAKAGLGARIGASIEEALVSIGEYQATSPDDVELLLEAQTLYMSGLFDESRLPSLGSFMPAPLALVSRLEPQSPGWLLQLRIVEIKSGKILRSAFGKIADDSLAESAARKAVFDLSGASEAQDASSGSFELVVTADVPGAEVLVDRKSRGTAPCAVAGLTPGEHLVEARKGAYFASKRIAMSANAKISFILDLRYGSLIVNATPAAPEVTIGGTYYGKKNFIERVPAERQELSLRLPGYFWKGSIPVFADSSATVNVKMLPTASLAVDADPLTRIRVRGQGFAGEYEGKAKIDDLLPGAYSVELERPNRERLSIETVLDSGRETSLAPALLPVAGLAARSGRLRDEIAVLESRIASQGLPAGLRAGPLPDLGLLSTGDLFVSFIPLVNTLLLFEPPSVPEERLGTLMRTRRAEFFLGSAAAAGIAGALLSPAIPEPARGYVGIGSMAVAALAGGADIGIGVYASLEMSRWYRATSEKKELVAKLDAEIAKLRADLELLEK